MKLSFFAVLLSTLVLNLMFQKDIAGRIKPDWNETGVEHGGTVLFPFSSADQLGLPESLILDIPPAATLEIGNWGPFKDTRVLMQGLEEKIDVLFVGDSSVSWGFDYHQFEVNSGLVARSLSYGLNVPDKFLARVVNGIAHCFMRKNGLVILSFANSVVGRKRGARPQDKTIRKAADLGNDCSKVSKFWLTQNEEAKTRGTLKLLLDREGYNRHVFNRIVDAISKTSPFWSARINLYYFIWPKLDIDGADNKANKRKYKFLRWDPAFRVPLGENFNTWKNKSVEMIDVGISEKVPNSKRRRENLSLWSDEQIGVPVCTAIPITRKAEIHRYAEWLHWGSNSCLLVYPNILRQVGVEQDLEMQSNHHFGNQSGLIMAAALGRYFNTHQVMKTYIERGSQPNDKTLYIRHQ